MDAVIDLQEIGFSFAIETVQEERLNFEVTKVDWNGKDGQKVKTKIEMIPCSAILGLDLPIVTEYSAKRSGIRNLDENLFICPEPSQELVVQGNFLSENFIYIEISLKRCAETQCANFSKI